jgi:hypothetical protein
MAGETESKSGVDYNLRIYSGKKITFDPDFEFSGKDVEKLYRGIEDKIERAEQERYRKKERAAEDKLKQFIGG